MAFNGSGTYTLPGAALTTGATVSSTENNTFRNDVAAAFNKTSTRDGQTVPTANLPMGGFKHTGLAAGTTAGDSVRFEQFSSPPAIGDVAPNTGKFTALTTTGNTILGDASTDTLNVGNGDLVKDALGNVGIGGTTSGVRLYVKGSTADTSSYPIYVQNSSGTDMFYIRADGRFITGTGASSPYNSTTGGGANMVVNSDGAVQRSTSSLKYKQNVQNASYGLADVMNLRPVTYESKNESETGIVYGGLIAEEVYEQGLTQFVQYADDGTPDALSYGNMVSLAFKAIQEQQALITSLTERITALEAK